MRAVLEDKELFWASEIMINVEGGIDEEGTPFARDKDPHISVFDRIPR